VVYLSRYAFRSTEKVALQEIGPRFTLKLRSLKKGLPAVNYLGDVAKPLEFDNFSDSEEKEKKEEKPAGDDQGNLDAEGESPKEVDLPKKAPPKADEYEWVWKVRSALWSTFVMSAVDISPPHSRSLKHRDVHSSFDMHIYTRIHSWHVLRPLLRAAL
jgi:hypothetical protein